MPSQRPFPRARSVHGELEGAGAAAPAWSRRVGDRPAPCPPRQCQRQQMCRRAGGRQHGCLIERGWSPAPASHPRPCSPPGGAGGQSGVGDEPAHWGRCPELGERRGLGLVGVPPLGREFRSSCAWPWSVLGGLGQWPCRLPLLEPFTGEA